MTSRDVAGMSHPDGIADRSARSEILGVLAAENHFIPSHISIDPLAEEQTSNVTLASISS